MDGKKILDFSKLFSGTLRTSITFDEFYTIIEYSEKLMSEYDKIDLDSDSLNVRIKDFANNMYDDKMSTVKIDINNLGSVTHVDMLSYQFAVCKLVKNILFRICDSSMYMILREDSAKADLINNIFEIDNVYFAVGLEKIKERGCTNLIDYSKSRYDIFEICPIIIRMDEIRCFDENKNMTILFPSEKFSEARKAKVISESATNPYK